MVQTLYCKTQKQKKNKTKVYKTLAGLTTLAICQPLQKKYCVHLCVCVCVCVQSSSGVSSRDRLEILPQHVPGSWQN